MARKVMTHEEAIGTLDKPCVRNEHLIAPVSDCGCLTCSDEWHRIGVAASKIHYRRVAGEAIHASKNTYIDVGITHFKANGRMDPHHKLCMCPKCERFRGACKDQAPDKVAVKLAKPDLYLLPGVALNRAAIVAAFGAEKYSEDGWKELGVRPYVNAALRHLYAYADGEKQDPETGLSHLDHALASMLFAVANEAAEQETGKGKEENA